MLVKVREGWGFEGREEERGEGECVRLRGREIDKAGVREREKMCVCWGGGGGRSRKTVLHGVALQLSKVNTVTLIAWLRERGVHCKTKDKKADLVERVKVFLALTSPEP